MNSKFKVVAGATGTGQDYKLASYLDFFAHKISIEKITHLHVVHKLYETNHYYATYNDAFHQMTKVIKEDKIEPLIATYKNVKNLEAVVVAGLIIPEFKNLLAKEAADLVALGRKTKGSSTLVKNIVRKIDSNVLIVPEGSTKTFTNILVPVDLSEHSSKLLTNAIALQEQSPEVVFITCLHAYEIPDIPYYNVLRTEARMHRDAKETVQKAFDTFIAKHQTSTSNITPVLIEESNSWPSQYILKYINENDVDFVMMGTTRHSRLDSLLGSTVEKIISHNDKCPTLLIK